MLGRDAKDAMEEEHAEGWCLRSTRFPLRSGERSEDELGTGVPLADLV